MDNSDGYYLFRRRSRGLNSIFPGFLDSLKSQEILSVRNIPHPHHDIERLKHWHCSLCNVLVLPWDWHLAGLPCHWPWHLASFHNCDGMLCSASTLHSFYICARFTFGRFPELQNAKRKQASRNVYLENLSSLFKYGTIWAVEIAVVLYNLFDKISLCLTIVLFS
jgi:hypothetical protein